ncbi:hypothetical protein [Leptodesmis sp.]|uniref:hypothetical protein n=1 Tax=Leptodesmis sp. TaxID=3100501 RepID=UPI0040535057
MTPKNLPALLRLTKLLISRHDAEMAEIRQILAVTARQTAVNQEAIANLTASIHELQNLVADYIQPYSKQSNP